MKRGLKMDIGTISEVARAQRALTKMSQSGTIDPDVAAVAADTLIDTATAIPRLAGNTRSVAQKRYSQYLAQAHAIEMAARSIQAAGTDTDAFEAAFKALCGLSETGSSQPQ